jgi:galactokinase
VAERAAAFAPGRVNLIGEHTDYNDGLCLPFAVRRGVRVAARPSSGQEFEVRALDLAEDDRFRAGERAGGWRAFARGCVGELEAAGLEVRPARLEISADLPRGAGLSSSAALCIATCMALCASSGEAVPDRIELARICSRVENDWAGAQTGLLDQLASLSGREGHAVRIDMRGLEIEQVPLALSGHHLVTLDSGALRQLGDSGYNERRAECRQACEALGLRSLRDADAHALADLPGPLARRLRHVLTENARVDATIEALRAADLEEAGRLLDASHESLRDDYEVSAPAVEAAVERAKEAGALGARIMGGGFGGHVLALFAPGAPLPADARVVEPGPGAHLA